METPVQIPFDAQVLDLVRERVPADAIDPAPAVDMPTAYVAREHMLTVCETLRDHPCLLYTSPSPRDRTRYRMPSSA